MLIDLFFGEGLREEYLSDIATFEEVAKDASLQGFVNATPSVGTDRHDALERHLLRNEQTNESLLNRLPNEVRQTTRNATRLDPADLPCVIGRSQILSHFLNILN